MVIVASTLYVLYMVSVFYYAARIFGIPIAQKKTLLLLTLINSFLVYLPVYITKFHYEQLLMILYFIVLGVELQLVYKQHFKTTFSALLCFIINYFGLKIMVVGIVSLHLQLPVIEVINQENLRLTITMLVFGILFPYILVSSRIMISKVVIYVFENLEVMRLACILLATVCTSVFISLPIINLSTPDVQIQGLYLIRIGAVALIIFIIIMIVLFLYSSLKKASITYKNTSDEIESETITITALEAEAITDFFTGFHVRNIGVNRLKKLIKNGEYGYAVYLDIDGLKTVNESLGHEEGDWYIRKVADEIRNAFINDTISRIGGDEFLIVGNQNMPTSIHQKTLQCFHEVNHLSSKYNKPYDTSISYGIREFDSTNQLSADELIEFIDDAMYKFKKKRNKERK